MDGIPRARFARVQKTNNVQGYQNIFFISLILSMVTIRYHNGGQISTGLSQYLFWAQTSESDNSYKTTDSNSSHSLTKFFQHLCVLVISKLFLSKFNSTYLGKIQQLTLLDHMYEARNAWHSSLILPKCWAGLQKCTSAYQSWIPANS